MCALGRPQHYASFLFFQHSLVLPCLVAPVSHQDTGTLKVRCGPPGHSTSEDIPVCASPLLPGELRY